MSGNKRGNHWGSAQMDGHAPQTVCGRGITSRDIIGGRKHGWERPAGWYGDGVTGKDIIGGPQTWLGTLRRLLWS
eukprot:1531061-Heterocapsa_arctica.AAC.1